MRTRARHYEGARSLRQTDRGVRWFRPNHSEPTFIYEAWAHPELEDDGEIYYDDDVRSDGYRLLIRISDLAEFLQGQGMELIVEADCAVTKKAKAALPMTIKSRPKLDSIGSSYSEWTVRYKLPNEMLVLGYEIVSALNLLKTVDTLGRWKAHHLAELVLGVRDAKEPDKAAAEARFADLLRNFDRRSGRRFRYTEGYDLKKIAPILDKILGKH